MTKFRAAGRLPVPVCALAFAMLIVAVGCGGGSGGSNPPTVAPSADADAMFRRAIAAMDGTTSLRYETTIYEGADSNGDIIETRIDEQAAPNRVRRRREIYAPERETEDVILIGITISTLKSDGTYTDPLDLEGQPPFAYPGDWLASYADTSGFEVRGEESLEGRNASVLRKYGPDPEDRPEDEAIQFAEDVIWIDKETGRVLRWDVNKYQGKNAADVQQYQHWESSLWQFNEDITIELPVPS